MKLPRASSAGKQFEQSLPSSELVQLSNGCTARPTVHMRLRLPSAYCVGGEECMWGGGGGGGGNCVHRSRCRQIVDMENIVIWAEVRVIVK